jgi:hypothetical protein
MTIYGYTLYLVVDLWMVGFPQMPHSNQDTRALIKSYHGALKHWLFWKQKGFKVDKLTG